MSAYTPDRWVVLEFETSKEIIRKVFAGWYGGYLGSDMWKLNSGITETRFAEGLYEFDGYSGSTYYCHPGSYGMSGLQASVLSRWMDQAADSADVKIKVLSLDEVGEL